MKSEADEPLLGSANRCCTPQPSTNQDPSTPVSPDTAPQVLPSPEDASNRPPASLLPLSFSLRPTVSRCNLSRPPLLKSNAPPKTRVAVGTLPLKRSVPAADAFGFTREENVTLIHNFKRDSFDAQYLEHQDLVSCTPERTSIIAEVDGERGQRAARRSSHSMSALHRSVLTAALVKAALPTPSTARQAQIALAAAAAASSAYPAAGERDAKAGEWREKDKFDRFDQKFPVPAATSLSAPSPSSVDTITSLQPSLSINLYPGGFSIDGRPSAQVYEAAHIPFLRSIGAGRLPVGCLLDVPNTEHLQFYNGCLLAEIKDHRVPVGKHPQSATYSAVTRRVLLQSDHLNTIADVEHMRRVCGCELSAADALKVEQDVMMRMQLPVCLEPSPNVGLVCNYSQFICNAARGCHPRPPLSSYRYQKIPTEEEQRMLLNTYKFEQDKPDSSRRTPKKPARAQNADGSDAPESLQDAAKSGLKLSASFFAPSAVVAPHHCTKPAMRRMRFCRKASGGREMTATIWVEMRRPSVYEGVVRVEEYFVTSQSVKDYQKPSCAQYQIGNALQVSNTIGTRPFDQCVFNSLAGQGLGQHYAHVVRARRLDSCR